MEECVEGIILYVTPFKESSEIFDYVIEENSSLIEVKKDHFVRGIKDEKN